MPSGFGQVYTVGYAQWTPDELEETGVTLIGVQTKAQTDRFGFNQEQLTQRPGARRYGHLDAFGNSNYEGSGIQFDAPSLGLAYLRALLQRGQVLST